MKLTKIKEAFDKMKEYHYDFKIRECGADFECQFLVNDLLIATGLSKKKKNAKHDCAEIGYDILMDNDFEFALMNGKKIPYGDYQEILKKYCKDQKIQYDIEKHEDQKYKKWTLISGPYKGEGYGLTSWKARNIASYNLHKSLISKQKQEQNHTINQQISSPSLITNQKQEQIHTINQQISSPPLVKVEPKIKFVIQTNTSRNLIKIENEHHTNGSGQDMIISGNQYNSELLAKEIGVSDCCYLKFSLFRKKLNTSGFRFHVLGSFNTKSVRITKPVLDIVLECTYLADLSQFLNKFKDEMQYEIESKENEYNLYFSKIWEQKQLKFSSLPLQVSIYLVNQIEQVSLIHNNYMIQYLSKFQQLNFSTQSLMLIHQWRDDAQINVPKELLDFLVVQVTNQFQYLNSPYQVLRQIIYLLQHGVLEEMKQYPNIELNPFLQCITDYYIETVQKFTTDQLIAIREASLTWTSNRVGDWLSTFQ